MPEVLQVELVKKPEAPPPVPEPETTPPEVVKPKIAPKPAPKPLPKPTPVVQTPKATPDPIKETAPPEPVKEVIAVSSEIKNPEPKNTIPIAEPIKEETPPPAPKISQVDIDDARGKYSNALWGAISKHKRYPKVAQMRGWQGEAIVELQLDWEGKLKSKKISQSSGYEALDKQALEMVEKALPFPTPPEALRGNPFTITIPVPFRLE